MNRLIHDENVRSMFAVLGGLHIRLSG